MMTKSPVPTPPDKADVAEVADAGKFTPPASQADLDRIIADRVARERAKYADYDELKAAAGQLAEIEEANKTEAEKLSEKLAALEKENAAFKQREQVAEWSKEITKDSHIPADALRGETEEELKAHFEQLLSLVPEPAPQQTIIPGAAENSSLALNGDGIENALKRALGI